MGGTPTFFPPVEGKADPAITQALFYLRRLVSGLQVQAKDSANFLTKTEADRKYSPAVLQQMFQSGGAFYLNVTNLPGILAQPQNAKVSTGTSTPNLLSPLSQNGTLFVVTPSKALYFFDGSTAPGTWKSIAATGITAFGLRSAQPAAGNSGFTYFQTDTKWTYIDNGTNYIYDSGVDSGTDATRAAIAVGANDNGALFLTTDTKKLWEVVGGAWTDETPLQVHNLLSATHSDTLAAAVVRGDVIVGNSTPAWARLGLGGAGNYLRSNGTDLVYSTIPVGDVPAHNLLSATHGDTLTASVVRGDVLVGNSTPAWARVAKGAVGTYLRAGATDTVFSSLTTPDVAANVTAVTVNANSTAAQNLQSLTIPANVLNVVGTSIDLKCYGVYTTQAAQTPSLTFAVTLGGVSLWSVVNTGVTLAAQTNAPWQLSITIGTVTTGAAGTLEVHGKLMIDDTAVPGAAMNAYPDQNTAPSAGIDLTAAETLQVTVKFSTQPGAGPFNAATGRLLVVR